MSYFTVGPNKCIRYRRNLTIDRFECLVLRRLPRHVLHQLITIGLCTLADVATSTEHLKVFEVAGSPMSNGDNMVQLRLPFARYVTATVTTLPTLGITYQLVVLLSLIPDSCFSSILSVQGKAKWMVFRTRRYTEE